MNNYLILRTLNSPYNDVTKGSTLTFSELDDNFIFLKGSLIYTAETSGNLVTLKTFNGNDLSFNVGAGGSDMYWTSGSTGIHSLKANNETMTSAGGDYAISSGLNTVADGEASWAEGAGTQALGSYSHAEGWSTIASGDGSSHAEGVDTLASGIKGSHAEGNSTIASNASAHAEGAHTIASGTSSHAEGAYTQAIGTSSHAEGNITTASGINSHTEGTYTVASGQAAHAEGAGTQAFGDYSHSEGVENTASGFASHTEGGGTQAIGEGSHAEGYGTTASGYTSHSEGQNTQAYGDSSHAEGYASQAFGAKSHAEGIGTQAIGVASHSEGSLTIASGMTSHAEGDTTIASGVSSHAEGVETTASGDVSHAEGAGTIASGIFSHAEGIYTTAIGSSSHAEGAATLASGLSSHAEGAQTQATGDYSHAGGSGSVAGGTYSVANGTDAITNGFVSSVFGEKVTVGADYSNIHGGSHNAIAGVSSTYSTIINGNTNNIIDSDTATILNGFTNTISGSSKQSSILNGQFNYIGQSQFASIIGGSNNEMADSDGSSLIGGLQNKILSDGNLAFTRYYNSIIGGYNNTIDNGELSFILGGYQNVIPYGTVGSVILGGDSITATTDNTVFVQRLNIKYAQNDNLTTKILTIDNTGLIKYRDISSISGGTGSGGTFTDIFWASGSTGNFSIKANNGTTTDSLGDYGVAFGFNTLVSGVNGFASGAETHAQGLDSVAQNYGAVAKGNYSHAGGYNSTASGDTSFIHSYQSSVSGARSAVLGGRNINGSADDTVYVPYLNIGTATTDNTIANILVKNGDGIVKSRQVDSLFSAVTSINVGSLTASTYYNLPVDTLSQVLASGNTTGANNIVVQDTKGLRTSDGYGGMSFLSGNFVRTYNADGGLNFATTDWETGGILHYASSGPITSEIDINGVNGNRLLVDASTASTVITQTEVLIEVTNSNTTTPGIQYAADYSTNFKNNTLVTRKFVETGMSGLTVNGTLSATTYLGLPTDIRVTGGTYSNGTTIFTNNTGGTFSVTGFSTGATASAYVTGFTYSNNNLTIKQSTGDLNVLVNTMTGLTVNGNITYTGQTNNPVYTAGTVTSTFIPNWNNSNIQTVILSAATTSISGGTNIANGASYTMILKQNATGSRVVTWGSQYKWQSGIAPVLTATANAVDILTFISDGTNLYGLIAKNFI